MGLALLAVEWQCGAGRASAAELWCQEPEAAFALCR